MPTTAAIRGDIQGLRALAVLLVVLGHLFPNRLPGGFIGVDIFFVISGYVITLQLIKLQNQKPTSFLADFYARRVRRILPSALLVLLFTYLSVRYFLGIVVANELSLDSFWASLFLANFHFQSSGKNYFDAGIAPSAIQHYWSLAVEEQFYLILPLIFLMFARMGIKRQTQKWIIAVLALSSFLYCTFKSDFQNQLIFFETFPRIFEIGVGVFLALSNFQAKIPRVAQILLLTGILISAFTLSPARWPNMLALPIVVASSALLVSNHTSQEISILNQKALVKIGDISFLIYLIHWPVLVICEQLTSKLTTYQQFSIFISTIVISFFLHKFYELPLRQSQMIINHPKISIVVALLVIVFLTLSFRGLYQS